MQDKEGLDSIDAGELKNGGSLLPLGGDRDHGSHKGFGLSSAVDIFSAVLSGASYGPWAPPFVAFLEPANDQPGEGLGHFLGAWRVDGFRPVDDYKRNIDQWIGRFKNAERIHDSQSVIIPGEPEDLAEQINRIEGIPLVDAVVNDLNSLAKRFGLQSI